jgi:hypothetical protein
VLRLLEAKSRVCRISGVTVVVDVTVVCDSALTNITNRMNTYFY